MKHLLHLILANMLLLLIVGLGVAQYSLVIPISTKEKPDRIAMKMERLGLPRQYASSVGIASNVSGLSTDFIIALTHSESNFQERAVSCKGYNGLLQIKPKVFDPDANLILGAKHFNEKMAIARGNTMKAICLYKGYDYDTDYGRKKAKMVILLYERLRKMET